MLRAPYIKGCSVHFKVSNSASNAHLIKSKVKVSRLKPLIVMAQRSTMPDQVVMSKLSLQSDLCGEWYNALGSKMSLSTDVNGGLMGTYCSAVGNAQDFYLLTGRFDSSPPSQGGVSIGWVVTFRNESRNAHSTTAWGGQYFDKTNGVERITTNWLMSYSTKPEDNWNLTNIGNDAFTRKKPSAAAIEHAQVMTHCSPRVEHILERWNKTNFLPDAWPILQWSVQARSHCYFTVSWSSILPSSAFNRPQYLLSSIKKTELESYHG